MRYVGGKTRIAPWVADTILQSDHNGIYLEPFVGSGAILKRVAPHMVKPYAGDFHKDLILMWKKLQSGWIPPEQVSREDYVRLRNEEPSALRGFVGYGASFSGKWFGGYVDTAWDSHHQKITKPYASAASRTLVKDVQFMKNVKFIHRHYALWKVKPGQLIYCDPPYANTLSYSATHTFNSELFWSVMERWSRLGAKVFVSEYIAPKGWKVVAERSRKAMLRVSHNEENETKIERIFQWGSE